MKNNVLTVDELLRKHPFGVRKESLNYKFVRLSNGDYIFHYAGFGCLDHAEMVEEDDKPVTAGTIMVAENDWSIINYFSSTLDLHVDDRDEDNLTKLFGRPHRHNRW